MAGWDELEAAQATLMPPASNDIDKLCVRVFGSDEGRKLLGWLREQTIEQPCWGPGADASYGYYLEGRCSLVKEIETRISRATKP